MRDDEVFVVVGLLIFWTARVMVVPLGKVALEIFDTKMDWVVEALHKTVEDSALTTDREEVTVQVPVAIEMEDGSVILTPAPTPRGLLICITKV